MCQSVSHFTLPPVKPPCPHAHSPRLDERLTLDWKVQEGDMGAEKNPLWKEPGKSIPGKENSMCKGVCLPCWRQCVWTGVRGRLRGEQVGEASRTNAHFRPGSGLGSWRDGVWLPGPHARLVSSRTGSGLSWGPCLGVAPPRPILATRHLLHGALLTCT